MYTHTHTHPFLPPHIPVRSSSQQIGPCPQSPSSSLFLLFFTPSACPCSLFQHPVAPNTHSQTHTQTHTHYTRPPQHQSTGSCSHDSSPQCAMAHCFKCTRIESDFGATKVVVDTFASLLMLEVKHRNLEWKKHTQSHHRIIVSDSISLISGEHEARVGF